MKSALTATCCFLYSFSAVKWRLTGRKPVEPNGWFLCKNALKFTYMLHVIGKILPRVKLCSRTPGNKWKRNGVGNRNERYEKEGWEEREGREEGKDTEKVKVSFIYLGGWTPLHANNFWTVKMNEKFLRQPNINIRDGESNILNDQKRSFVCQTSLKRLVTSPVIPRKTANS